MKLSPQPRRQDGTELCGIAGLWRLSGPDPNDPGRLVAMAASILHRGPDDHGYLLASSRNGDVSVGQSVSHDMQPDVLLASRRLSIVDLSVDGRQPISDEAGDVFVVFNGAIHNYQELRRALEGLGHTFRSETDTEVIVHAYEEWGTACARRFNGMWAYAIWDRRRAHLVLSRDRFGVKPLYVAARHGVVLFGSEIKAILAAEPEAAVANAGRLSTYITEATVDLARSTFFDGIDPIRAGYNTVITREGIRQEQYWA